MDNHEAVVVTNLQLDRSEDSITVTSLVIALCAIVGGTIICMAGYRLFRPTIFCCGFFVGGAFVAGIIESAFSSMEWMSTAAYLGFAIGGLLTGIMVLVLYSASIFLAGAAGGIMLACTFTVSFGARLYPSNPDLVLVIVALILGISSGILALKLEKPVLVTTTAFVGAAICIWGIGSLAGDYSIGLHLQQYRVQNEDGDWVYTIPDARWGYLTAMLVLFILGMAVQIKKTARGYDHRGHTGRNEIVKTSRTAAV